MKPEFSDVLIPPVRVSNGNLYHAGNNSNSSKWLAVFTIIFAIVVTVLTITIVIRYESQFSQYEQRLLALEEELGLVYRAPHHGHMEGLHPDLEDLYDEEVDELDHLEDGHQEEVSRRKRQIPNYDANVPRTSDGVPILEGSYLDRVNSGSSRTTSYVLPSPPTTDSEGLRLYEGLVTSGGRNEPKSAHYSSNPNPQLEPILPYHRTSAAWSEKTESASGRSANLQVRSGDVSRSSSTGPSFSDDVFYTRSTRKPSTSSTGAGSTAIHRTSSANYQSLSSTNLGNNYSPYTSTVHRASRVPNTGDDFYPQNTRARDTRAYQYPPLKKLGQGDGEVVARVLQSENEADVEGPSSATASANFGETASSHSYSRRRHNGQRRHNPASGTANTGRRTRFQQRKEDDDSGEISIVKAEAWVEGPKTIAGHFVADVSNYTTSHRHYEGNGRLRNQDGFFSSWVPSDWMAGTEMSKAFSISERGVITVKNAGIYYIYAQIHYLDDHDINGYVVQVNTDTFLQCTTMTETQNGGSKSNSCFTAGIRLLKENDRIVIKDIETNRFSIFKPEKSFFGLMRIGDGVR